MKPIKREIKYEKVKTNDFVIGVIQDIKYEKDHEFTHKGETKTLDAVKIIFHVDGYKYPKQTPWMTFSYGEKTNLYTKYLSSLVEGAKPNMDFDLDQLKGLKVKMLWKNKGEYQHIETIRPVGKMVTPLNQVSVTETIEEEEVEESSEESIEE